MSDGNEPSKQRDSLGKTVEERQSRLCPGERRMEHTRYLKHRSWGNGREYGHPET